MNLENSVVEKLVRSVETVLEVLELFVVDLAEVLSCLKGLVEDVQPPRADAMGIMQMLPEKLRGEVSINEEGDYVIVKLKRLLRAEAFKALVDVIITKLGGEYVSMGGGRGYFRIPRTSRQTHKLSTGR